MATSVPPTDRAQVAGETGLSGTRLAVQSGAATLGTILALSLIDGAVAKVAAALVLAAAGALLTAHGRARRLLAAELGAELLDAGRAVDEGRATPRDIGPRAGAALTPRSWAWVAATAAAGLAIGGAVHAVSTVHTSPHDVRAVRAAARPVSVQVPNVTGLTAGEAQAVLGRAGLGVAQGNSDGLVVDQSPAPGAMLRGDGAVRLTVGAAPATQAAPLASGQAAVPDLVGSSVADAQGIAKAEGFVPEVSPGTAPDWTVFSQKPGPGQGAAPGAKVFLGACPAAGCGD